MNAFSRAATPLEIALGYINRGWSPLPVRHRGKRPSVGDEWQHLRIDATSAAQYFNGRQQNIGVMLGQASDGLTDVDLDCPEAIRLAARFLPDTEAIFGRASNPRSHWLYVTLLCETEALATVQFKDPARTGDSAMMLEVRIGAGKGAQTVFPGSTHESGEPIEWASAGDPEPEDGARLMAACSELAAASLLARHWGSHGDRNGHRMALAGLLSRRGWAVERVAHFVGAVTAGAGGEDDQDQRLSEARNTAERLSRGELVSGFPKLAELVGDNVAARSAKWLGIDTGKFAEVPEAVEVTEDGIARLFTARHSETMRYDHDAGRWFEWAPYHWRPDGTSRAYSYCRELARQATEGADPRSMATARKAAFAGGVERMARSDILHAVTQDAWDRDPWLLGCPGMTVDLRDGGGRTPDPADGITKQAAVAPTTQADCPRWKAFLAEATGGDAEMIRFLQQWCGYALTGDTREHALVFIYGDGGNGKSVFLNTLTGILGDYAATAGMDTFTASKSDRHPTDLAMLRGARLVSASETEEGRAWAESRIKQLTGGDLITARFMRQDFFTYQPQFKLLIVGNHKPALHNVDDAARRRFNIVPFVRKPVAPDRQLEEKLRSEWPAILRWMIDGCSDWRPNGLLRPARVAEATAAYFADQDFFAQWLEDDCITDTGNTHRWESSADLFTAWRDYAKAAGEEPGSRKRLAENMTRRGFESVRKKLGGKQHRAYLGISLVRPEPAMGDG